jgi:hypothetical protein
MLLLLRLAKSQPKTQTILLLQKLMRERKKNKLLSQQTKQSQKVTLQKKRVTEVRINNDA